MVVAAGREVDFDRAAEAALVRLTPAGHRVARLLLHDKPDALSESPAGIAAFDGLDRSDRRRGAIGKDWTKRSVGKT